MSAGFPEVRPRRLRGTRALRAMVAETAVRPAELVLPVFSKEGIADPQPIGSMPGVVQHTRESLRKELVWNALGWADAPAKWKDAETLAIEYSVDGATAAATVERKLSDPSWKRVQ